MALKFIDIGANLTDPMFRGIYGSTQKHTDDMEQVLQRAWEHGMKKMIITVGQLEEANIALALAKQDERLFMTIGCHPTRCRAFLKEPEKYYEGLRARIADNLGKVVAIGECGLDYDRLHFCEKETQKIYFEKQLNLAAEFKLPLFLHCRNSYDDFFEILKRNRDNITAGGVVHSFDGSFENVESILSLGNNFYIGLNGCSLKTPENLAVIKQIPNDRIMLETDCPWCGIRNSHASQQYVQTKFPIKKKEKWSDGMLVDGRAEPCQIRQVLEVIAGVKEQPAEQLARTFYENTVNLFFSNQK